MMNDEVTTNEQVDKVKNNDNVVVLDVREVNEYVSGHVPGSVLIPLGQLQGRYDELEKDKELYVICRTGNRSGMACQFLRSLGFEKVYNVLPGMINWTGEVELG